MDRLIWIVLAAAFAFGLVMVIRRSPPSPPPPGAGEDPVGPSHVIRVDLADRD
jgi:hypothetical protein